MTTPKEALERIIQIYERNAGRQNEKLADIPLVARRALASFEGDAVERERCAQIAVSHLLLRDVSAKTRRSVAAAIRAGGE